MNGKIVGIIAAIIVILGSWYLLSGTPAKAPPITTEATATTTANDCGAGDWCRTEIVAEIVDATPTLRSLGGTLGGNVSGWKNNPVSKYAVDDAHAYYAEKMIDADAATLEVIKGSLTIMMGYILEYEYARDSRAVFYKGKLLPGATSATFRPIENGPGWHNYGTDERTVYFGAEPISGADPKTFKILWQNIYEGCYDTQYSKDVAHVYLSTATTTITVPDADPATFEPFSGIGKDSRGYYKGATYVGPTIDKQELYCGFG
ncbi:MAG: DKNYY domain-containing protein [bacterium]|nr:DKNYY domain-containing protein [bacterium]